MRVSPAANTKLGYDANWRAGINNKGEVLLADDRRLRKYKFRGSDYTEVTSITFPKRLDCDCWKELSNDRVFIQQDEDSVTLTLSADDLRQESQSQHRGLLRGCLPQGDLVYGVNTSDGYILETGRSKITLKPPTGAWKERYLSLCCSSDRIFVTESGYSQLDVFTRQGNKMFMYCCIVYS